MPAGRAALVDARAGGLLAGPAGPPGAAARARRGRQRRPGRRRRRLLRAVDRAARQGARPRARRAARSRAAGSGWAASGRNGGFCAASLTHGEANGRARWPQEYATLHRLGRENLDEIEQTVARYGIDCDFQPHR